MFGLGLFTQFIARMQTPKEKNKISVHSKRFLFIPTPTSLSLLSSLKLASILIPHFTTRDIFVRVCAYLTSPPSLHPLCFYLALLSSLANCWLSPAVLQSAWKNTLIVWKKCIHHVQTKLEKKKKIISSNSLVTFSPTL